MNRYDLIILGSIAQTELSGYDIIQRVKDIGMDKWAKIHVSTVYARLNALSSKGHLNFRTEKDSNRPERTIYNISDSGRMLLAKQVISHLTGFNDDPRTLGFAYLYGASFGELLPALRKQTKHLEVEIERIEKMIEKNKENSFYSEGPFLNCMSRDHMKVELKYFLAAIEILEDPEKAVQMTNFFSINHKNSNLIKNQKTQEI